MNTKFIRGQVNYIMTGKKGLIFKFNERDLPYALLADGSWECSPSAIDYIYDSQYSFIVLNPNDFVEKDGKTFYIGSVTPEDVNKVVANTVESKHL